MNPDDLDRILASDKMIEPSSSFSGEVMTRIRAEAFYGRGIPFPWVWFIGLTLAAAIVASWIFPAQLRTVNLLCYSLGNWILSPSDMALRNALLFGIASLSGTLLLVWFSFRLAGSRP